MHSPPINGTQLFKGKNQNESHFGKLPLTHNSQEMAIPNSMIPVLTVYVHGEAMILIIVMVLDFDWLNVC
jgi:hypothetical protein